MKNLGIADVVHTQVSIKQLQRTVTAAAAALVKGTEVMVVEGQTGTFCCVGRLTQPPYRASVSQGVTKD